MLIATSLLILFLGEEVWTSRWQPGMLAITHLFTLGFMSMVMMGALYQFLPVIGGVGIVNANRVANVSHGLHTIGTLALVLNFIMPTTLLLMIAISTLGLGFLYYIYSVARVLIKKLSQGDTIVGIRIALLSLLLVVVLGLLILIQNSSNAFSRLSFLADKNYTDIHALFGGFGWGGLLIFAVSLQVIPMFHVTPNFPKLLARWLPAVAIVLLLLLFVITPNSVVGSVLIGMILVLLTFYNLVILKLFRQRKRKVTDTSVQFWQFSASSFFLLVCLYFLPDTVFDSVFSGKKSLLFGAVFVYFYLVSIIEAMLLKITSFLPYTHLQNLCMTNFSAMAHLPHMHELLLKKHGRWLFYGHLLSCIALVVTLADSAFYWLFGMAMLIEFTGLLALMLRSLYLYKQCLNKIEANSTV